MGSFNITCGISGLPVIETEEVYVIPIQRRVRIVSGKVISRRCNEGNDVYIDDIGCYADDWWKPFSPSFKAKYTGYGSFIPDDYEELEKGLYVSLNSDDSSFNNVAITEQGANEYHDLAFNWAKLSKIENKEEKWKRVEECINKNRVFVENYFFKPTLTQISFCVMKESVYDFFLKNCTKEKVVNPVDIFHYFSKRLLPFFYQSECNDTYSELLKYQKQEVKRLDSRYYD
nr:MAG TPA: hypothetical protein [Caudoviricetes sp.]